MKEVKIKLFYTEDGVNEITTFKWFMGKLDVISIEGHDIEYGNYSSLNPNDNIHENEDDIKMVKSYIEICGSDLVALAMESDSTICFKKEIWLDSEPAIVESWLEKDECSMLRKSTRIEYFNNVLNTLSI